MADYVSKLRADTTQHDKALEESAKKVSTYKSETDKASASVDKMNQSTSKSTASLLKEMSSLENTGRATSNYRKQLMQLERQIADLTIGYRQMSDAERQSTLGQEVAAKIDELKQKASQYKDAIADVNAEIKNMASDTAGWDAMKQGIGLVSSSLQTFISVTGLSEKESAKLLQIMNKVKLAEVAANSAIKIGNALQKQSALMAGIRNLQTKAATAATNAQTAATGRATIAQAAFNAVAKANPYVLLASAIITVVGALALFANKSDEVTKSQDHLNDALKTSAKSAGENVAKFKILQNEYNSLKSVADKQQWIKDNADKLNELGISIDKVNDAEQVFKERSDDMIRAIKLRAEAAAIASKYQEQYAKAYEESLKVAEGKQADFMPSSTFRSNWKKAGLDEGDYTKTFTNMQSSAGAFSQAVYTLTPAGEEKMKKYWEERGNDVVNAFADGVGQNMLNTMQEKLDEAESLAGKWSKKNTTTTKEKPEKIEVEVDEDEFEKSLVKATENAKKTLKNSIKDNGPIIKSVEMFDGSPETIEKTFRENNNILNKYNSELQKITATIDKLKVAQEELEKVGGEDQSKWTDEAIQSYNELGSTIVLLTREYEGIINKANDLIKVQNELNNKLKQDDAQKRIEEHQKEISDSYDNMYDGIKDVWSASKGWAESLDSIAEKWDEMSSGERFTSIVDSIFNTIDMFKSLADSINSVNTALKTLGIAENMFAGIEQITTALHIKNEKEKQKANLETAATSATEGGIEAVKGGASAGWPAMLFTIPLALAAVIGAVSKAKSIKGYAGGGIITAPTSVGDYNLARVNDGEMILNSSQQSRLFRLANEGGSNVVTNQPQQVEFKLRGNELIGLMKNYNGKINKV